MLIGIDLGGTKIEAAAIDSEGCFLKRERVPTPGNDYEATLQVVGDLVVRTERALGRPGKVGVGMPGSLSTVTDLVKNANSTHLIGRPLHRDLERILARPVRVANDADCFALSEAVDGAGAGASVVFGVILGTGVGGGIVAHGRLLEGPNRVAGEWGHNPLPWPRAGEQPGPECYCGKRGCIETFLSGAGLIRSAREDVSGTLGDARTPESCEEVAASAEAGEPWALAACERYRDRLARALAGVINVVDPDVIVLGGGLSNIPRLYESLPLARYVFSDHVATPIARARHGDSSGVRGAAWLWDDRFADRLAVLGDGASR